MVILGFLRNVGFRQYTLAMHQLKSNPADLPR